MNTPLTTIAVYPGLSDSNQPNYRAIAGNMTSEGATIGQAIDSLTGELGDGCAPRLILVQTTLPDRFFTADQQARLSELLARNRETNISGEPFSDADRKELEELIDLQLRATEKRLRAYTEISAA